MHGTSARPITRAARLTPLSAARDMAVLTRTYHEPISPDSFATRFSLEPADVADCRRSALSSCLHLFQIPNLRNSITWS
jgi:hypothetical protein